MKKHLLTVHQQGIEFRVPAHQASACTVPLCYKPAQLLLSDLSFYDTLVFTTVGTWSLHTECRVHVVVRFATQNSNCYTVLKQFVPVADSV